MQKLSPLSGPGMKPIARSTLASNGQIEQAMQDELRCLKT
jgi:hypothetical protein